MLHLLFINMQTDSTNYLLCKLYSVIRESNGKPFHYFFQVMAIHTDDKKESVENHDILILSKSVLLALNHLIGKFHLKIITKFYFHAKLKAFFT